MMSDTDIGVLKLHKANKLMGRTRLPDKDLLWHCVEDGKTMQAVPMDLHNAVYTYKGIAKKRGIKK